MSEITEALERIFSADASIYQQRGFQRRVGFGERPALTNIDLANAWTRPGNPFSCDGMDVIIPGVQRLLAASRAKGLPVVYTTTAYAVTEGPNSDMGIWKHKIPLEALQLGTEAVAIDERIAPEPGEQVVVKKRASAFHGTYLSSFLKAHRVDTVVVTGVTMAGCPRVGLTGEKRTFHSFRHTFAKRALENGRQITWLSRHLGHSSLSVTTEIYGHFERAERKREVAMMEGVFGV
jgi:maleamate amidohydrolase